MRLIDADELTEIIHGMYAEGDDPSTYHVDAEGDTLIGKFAVIDTIFNMPTIQPEPHWIPCSERLPENGRQVLVYARSVHYALAKYDEMREADGTYKKQWVTFDAWKPFYSIKEVIAWRELSVPFGEE